MVLYRYLTLLVNTQSICDGREFSRSVTFRLRPSYIVGIVDYLIHYNVTVGLIVFYLFFFFWNEFWITWQTRTYACNFCGLFLHQRVLNIYIRIRGESVLLRICRAPKCSNKFGSSILHSGTEIRGFLSIIVILIIANNILLNCFSLDRKLKIFCRLFRRMVRVNVKEYVYLYT